MNSPWIFPQKDKVQASMHLHALPSATVFCSFLKMQRDTNTHFVFSHPELPQLADGIRAEPGRPARLCATAPGSRAVVCLTTWRTRKQTGARATATISLGCVASQSLPQPWHKPRPKMMAVCPCSRPLPKLFTPAEHFQSPLQLWNEALYLTLTQKHLLPRE